MTQESVNVIAKLNGSISEVSVKAGDTVSEGDTLFLVEAEKSLLTVGAPYAGVVETVRHAAGDDVMASDCIVELKRSDLPR